MPDGIGELIDHVDAIKQDAWLVVKQPKFIEVIKTGSHFVLHRAPSRGVRIIEFHAKAASLPRSCGRRTERRR